MLEQDCDEPFAKLIASAPLRLVPPPGLTKSRHERDRAVSFPFEDRQAARIPTLAQAAIQISRALAAFPRDGSVGGAILLDVSLRGLRVLYDEQLFPKEEVCVWLPSAELHGEVARCRRLTDNCYEVGVRLDAPLPSWLLKAALRG